MPPDEVPRLKATFEKVLRGTPSQTETHWLAKDGRRLLVGWSNRGVAVEGSVESVIATASITPRARRLAEGSSKARLPCGRCSRRRRRRSWR